MSGQYRPQAAVVLWPWVIRTEEAPELSGLNHQALESVNTSTKETRMGSMRIRTILLALAAVFAMSAVASATASAALPLLPILLNKEGKDLTITLFKGTSGESTFETKSGESVRSYPGRVM